MRRRELAFIASEIVADLFSRVYPRMSRTGKEKVRKAWEEYLFEQYSEVKNLEVEKEANKWRTRKLR